MLAMPINRTYIKEWQINKVYVLVISINLIYIKEWQGNKVHELPSTLNKSKIHKLMTTNK